MRTTSKSMVGFFLLSTCLPSFAVAEERISFNRDIRPILSDKCFSCHGTDKNARKADLRLDHRDNALHRKAIVPRNSEQSALMERVLSTDPDLVMPPVKSNKSLTDSQKQLLKRWIDEGAEYQPHWAFVPIPDPVPVPHPNDPAKWIRSPIDAFVLERLHQNGLEPAAESTREKWLRRASFDLTGLPPSITELDQFLGDRSADAYEAAVDRMLKSTAFGERLANEWLDVARYADTFGYQADREMHVWPWRDWVIRAFNENLSYDKFILWQTAGDLLPHPTRDQQLATAFNRLHRQTNEGGSVEEEFRQAYIADRVVTNGTAFLGMTFECCRCHDHKYDPISQDEFYKLAAFFSNIDEHGLYSHFTETAPTPAMLLYRDGEQQQHAALLEKVRLLETELDRVREEARARFHTTELSTVGINTSDESSAALGESAIKPKLHQPFDDVKVSGENQLVAGIAGQAIQFGGDDSFACAGSGQYGRTDPFTIAFWVKPAENKPRTVIAHQSVAAEDASYRGYSLVLDDGVPQFSLVHFWPGNAIQVRADKPIPVNEWTHLAIVYDGSSHAKGVRLLVNGRQVETKFTRDQLTRDLRYRKEWGDSSSGGVELALGARFRDFGFRHGLIDELHVFESDLSNLEVARLALAHAPKDPADKVVPVDIAGQDRFEHYLLRHDPQYRDALEKLRQARTEEDEFVTKIRQIMVMKESAEPRPTHVLKRGAYDAPGERVTADTPGNIMSFSHEWPRNRLGFAKWMIDRRNPLTSRVAVNRPWSLFFGRGLVPSLEDFGGQGQLPSHPELLDWLARDFMNGGWDVKQFCKQVVLSATYRQSTQPRNPKTYQDDPENVWLARSSRYRLPAEQLRDSVLAVSGLLVNQVGGPSVMPYQPVGLWEESGTGKSYHQSKGEGLYRRSLYTFWRRTSPPPSMLTFDATGREVCTARRERTATPLQALVLLNDPQFIEASRVLAEKQLKVPNSRRDDWIRSAFRMLTSRLPDEKESAILNRLFDEQQVHFGKNSSAATEFLAIGDSPRDQTLNPADHAALTVTIKAIMSFDESVTKR